MPVKLSETPSLYQPGGVRAELEADLERFSDPEEFDQNDPLMQVRQAEIRALLGMGAEDSPTREDDRLRSVLMSLLGDEAEVEEALSHGNLAQTSA